MSGARAQTGAPSGIEACAAPAPSPPARAAPGTVRARIALGALTLAGCAIGMTLAARALLPGSVWDWIALGLLGPSLLWISAGAGMAILGLVAPAPRAGTVPAGWRPSGRTAVLLTLCREDPGPVARRLEALHAGLARRGLAQSVSLQVLSDTSGAAEARAEAAALHALIASGRIGYRRRSDNVGRKPGNIADWVLKQGEAFDFMLVLDADSRMSAARIGRLIRRMEDEPGLGLLQAGVAIAPARSRFGRLQRLASRLLAPGFAAGLAAFSGREGNFWGHNAILRTRAFRSAAIPLPVLPGKAPLGGPILSHDFVEAALLRAAGWGVALDPDLRGSAEEAPETLAAFHKRDRRWCQGNLQHLRLIAAPGLHPVSRLHMAAGIGGYLTAPIWLALLLLGATGAVQPGAAAPLVWIAALLAVPKLCGLAGGTGRRTRRRRRVRLGAAGAELALSALVAPLVMLRQSASVLAVALGRDCGWKRPDRARRALPDGWAEAAAGVGLGALAAAFHPPALPWLVPAIGPMMAAPWVEAWLAASPSARRGGRPSGQRAEAEPVDAGAASAAAGGAALHAAPQPGMGPLLARRPQAEGRRRGRAQRRRRPAPPLSAAPETLT